MRVPKFFFHIRNGLGFTEDEEGQELASVEDARAAAVVGARSLLSAEVVEGQLDLRGRIEVRDGEGRGVATVEFGDVVEIRRGAPPPI